MRAKVSLDLMSLYLRLHRMGIEFITVEELASMLSISTQSSGHLLAKMERLGLVERFSRRTYRVKTRGLLRA